MEAMNNRTQATETPQISTETAETVHVSEEGENKAERAEMPQILNCEWQTVEHFKAIPNIAKLAKAGIIINGVSWHTEYLDQAHNVLARVDNLGWHEDGNGFGGFQGSGVFGKTAIFKSWDNAVITMIDALTDYLRTRGTKPPQSPETPQTVECTAESNKNNSKHEKAITMLNTKLENLQKEANKYDDRNCLPRKLYFKDAKRQVRIGEQCTAICAALDILRGKQWHELDIYNVVLMSVNSRNSEKDKLLEYAYSRRLYEKQNALMYALETSLPICKKQILDAIQMQTKNSRLANTA